jgi:hypothetical protein
MPAGLQSVLKLKLAVSIADSRKLAERFSDPAVKQPIDRMVIEELELAAQLVERESEEARLIWLEAVANRAAIAIRAFRSIEERCGKHARLT